MARILFFVWKLEGGGGAERQLVNLAKGLAKIGHEVTIGVWVAGGSHERELAGSGIRCELLRASKYPGLRLMRLVASARALARHIKPHVVHGYMDTANFIAALLDSPQPECRVVWGVRSSSPSQVDLSGWVIDRANRFLSKRAALIIANSAAGAAYAAANGYPADRLKVIHNGVDTERFRHDADGAARSRREWGIRPGERVIGMAARLDPIKDYGNFVAAARLLAARRPEVRFVCVGEGTGPDRGRMLDIIRDAQLGERLQWRGFAEDVPAFYSALDLATSTSHSEGFSNVIAEAMACGIPCVVTDVGDSALLVGETGRVVPRRDPVALASAWERALQDSPTRPRPECRARIVQNFSIARLVAETEAAILPPELPRLARVAHELQHEPART
jgi:glycosyltransferase involved in cell wall biosynthesis